MRSRSARGFTLVEAVVIMVLAGMIMSIALPRFRERRNSYLLDTAAFQLAGDLRRAQIEAIKRNTPITLTRVNDSTYNINFIGDRRLDNARFVAASSAASVQMAAFGPPTSGARTFVVALGGRQKTVNVSAAGLVSVQ